MKPCERQPRSSPGIHARPRLTQLDNARRAAMDARDDDLHLALRLADLADAISMARFDQPDLGQHVKGDSGIVTEADLQIEQVLRAELDRVRPRDAILGEEFGGTADHARVWMLDPIDGTAAFAAGNRDWSTLISLVEDGAPVVGVVSRPAWARRWWAAEGRGAFADGRRIRVSRTNRLGDAVMCDDFRHSAVRQILDNPVPVLAARCAHVIPWLHRASTLLPIAEAQADFLLNWWGGSGPDLSGGVCILTEAGGRFSDLHGVADFNADVQLMSNGVLHDELLATVNQMIDAGQFDPTIEPTEDLEAIRRVRRHQSGPTRLGRPNS